jgi:branched-subunit amino acid ABC-type transport system permease component
MRGTAGNPVLAESCGIRTEHVLTLTWLGSGILCGAGGVLFAIYVGSFTYSSWESVLPLIIATAIVGGIGSPQGAMIAAVIVAVVSSVAAGYLSPAFEDVIALGMLTVVMLIRPTGLFAAVG